MNLTRGINLRKIAELMPGASGAEVKVITLIQYMAFSVYKTKARKLTMVFCLRD
jgi:ATP-dependent 26S proteasome regulatory subunit